MNADYGNAAPKLAGIFIYPFKSAGGLAVDECVVDEMGLALDRRWMLVDGAGRFMSQRTHHAMALLRVSLGDASLRVTVKDDPGRDALELPLAAPEQNAPHVEIHVWFGGRYATDCGPGPASWFSDFMGEHCRVVRAVTPAGRDRVDASGRVRAGFADAEPALVISCASLDDLNRRLTVPLPMNRFRPNLVLDGLPPYAEDRMRRVRIGDVVMNVIRPCPRCALTTVDQDTALAGKEPLRTLASYRRMADGNVAFGMNARFENGGTIRTGTPLSTEPAASP